jgi:hypothetical protein
LQRFLQELGNACEGPGRVYLTGGASAVLLGWRDSTIDIHLKFAPEPKGVFAQIPGLKNLLQVNVELASPDNFVPALPGWEARSPWIASWNAVERADVGAAMPEDLQTLPGAELVLPGLRDIAAGRLDTVEALLVAIGSPRLRRLGFDLPDAFPLLPEHALYHKLCELHGDTAHSRYNGLGRRLVSFERACAMLRRMEEARVPHVSAGSTNSTS